MARKRQRWRGGGLGTRTPAMWREAARRQDAGTADQALDRAVERLKARMADGSCVNKDEVEFKLILLERLRQTTSPR